MDSKSFREYTATTYDLRGGHEGVGGLNSCVLITGSNNPNITSSYFTRLDPKSLQELAIHMIYKNHAALPWKQLPMKLIQKIMGTSPEEDIDKMM